MIASIGVTLAEAVKAELVWFTTSWKFPIEWTRDRPSCRTRSTERRIRQAMTESNVCAHLLPLSKSENTLQGRGGCHRALARSAQRIRKI